MARGAAPVEREFAAAAAAHRLIRYPRRSMIAPAPSRSGETRGVRQMARKKRERGNGQGTVAPRRNKAGKIIGYLGAFFGPDGKRYWVSAKTKTECWRKLNIAMADTERGILPAPANLTVERYLTSSLADSVKGTVSRATYDGYKRDVHHTSSPSSDGASSGS